MGVRHVRDAAFWGVPAGTVIAPGMKPRPVKAAAKMAKGAAASPGARPSAAAMFHAGAGKGRLHAATWHPMPHGPSRPMLLKNSKAPHAPTPDELPGGRLPKQAPSRWGGPAVPNRGTPAAKPKRSRTPKTPTPSPTHDVSTTAGRKAALDEAFARQAAAPPRETFLHVFQAPDGPAKPLGFKGARTTPKERAAKLREAQLREAAAPARGNEGFQAIADRAPAGYGRTPTAPTAKVPKAPSSAGTTGRHPGYDGMDIREVDSILDGAGISTAGMDRDQKLAALAARDERIGVARFGIAPGEVIRSPERPANGNVERTEIGGWKTPRPGSVDAARGTRDESLRQLADALPRATSREQARAALSGLTAPELRALAGELGASVGARHTKAQLIARLVEVAGSRLDSAAIQGTRRKSARQLMGGS